VAFSQAGLTGRLRQALALLRAGQWSALGEKLRRRLRMPPLGAVSSGQLWDLASESGASPVSLHIAAALGGGAEDVLRRRIEDELARGENPVLLSLDSLTGELVASWYSGDRQRRARLGDYPFEAPEALAPRLRGIRCNSLVGFPRPQALFSALRALATDHGVPLAIEWHDHYLACPVQTLLDHEGRYCGIPAPERCAVCLAANGATLPAGAAEAGIGSWRRATAALLDASSEILAFSRASAEIIARSFGHDFAPALRVSPHAMDYFAADGPLRLPQPAQLHVGVIGRIGLHKGAREVAALAREIGAQGADCRITVIGTIDTAVDGKRVAVTGAYAPAELPRLVRDTGVNVILLPSICPETFSFVAHEVMAMDLPLLTLALGAQGECAAAYAKGRTVADADPGRLLGALQQLFADSYGATGA
jgi:glycosyltransferase involved in cell wall biosynthesis